MDNEPKKDIIVDNQQVDFFQEYQKIIEQGSNTTVVINCEWQKSGDNFKKLSIYDSSYTPVKTLGNTTLIS